MARALTVARVTVPTAREAEYLVTTGRLAALLQARGQHLWVFRRPELPGEFLEFLEAGSAASHSAVAPTPAETALLRRLRELGTYAPGADAMWLEVSLHGAHPSDHSS